MYFNARRENVTFDVINLIQPGFVVQHKPKVFLPDLLHYHFKFCPSSIFLTIFHGKLVQESCQKTMPAISKRIFCYIWHPSNEILKNNIYPSMSCISKIFWCLSFYFLCKRCWLKTLTWFSDPVTNRSFMYQAHDMSHRIYQKWWAKKVACHFTENEQLV